MNQLHHVFPQLRKLERHYSRELAVIGVHSAKFTSEKDTDNLRKAVLRYELEHPWLTTPSSRCGSSTPAALAHTHLHRPEGRIIGKHEGEITFEDFDPLIGQMVDEFDRQGTIDRTPLSYRMEAERGSSLVLPRKGAGRRSFR